MAQAITTTDGSEVVLAWVWADSNIVQGLTTIHDFLPGDYVLQQRQRPSGKSSLVQKAARKAYGDSPQCVVIVPSSAYDYNQYMGGVDIADQLRSYYKVQITARRNWLPLFYGILDISIVNTYLL
ncbi:hypothetical protein BJ508DRAFT_341772, partial [Ascobolus immersus RN42]